MPEPASAERRFRLRRVLSIVLLGLTLAAALATVHFRISRGRAVARAEQAHARAVALDECLGDRDELRLGLREEKPLAACAERSRSAAASALALDQTAYRRSPEKTRELVRLAREMSELPWDATAKRLLEPPLSETFSKSRAMRALAREIAQAEGAALGSADSRATSSGVLAPQVVVERELGDPIVDVELVAWSQSDVALATVVARTKTAAHAWVVRSTDRGKSWRTLALPAAPRAARLEVAREASGALAIGRVDDDRQVSLGRWQDGASALAPIHSEPILLPAGHELVTTGSSLLATADAVVLVAQDHDGGARLLYPPYDANSWRAAPSGQLVAATSSPPARLVLSQASKTGFVQLAQLAVPNRGDPWPEPVTTLVSYVSGLSPLPGPDRACGLKGEKFFTWLGQGSKKHVLVASDARHIYPFRFDARPGATVELTCGGCPPGAFEKSAQGLRVFPAVRRQLAPTAVETAIAFEPSSLPTAVAACSEEQVVVAYVADERVVAQGTRGGTWRFDHARVIAQPDARGTPRDVRLIGFSDRTLVLFRRAHPGSRTLRVEATELMAR